MAGWRQTNVIDSPTRVAVNGVCDPHQEKRHRKACWQAETKCCNIPLLSTIWLLSMYTHIHLYC